MEDFARAVGLTRRGSVWYGRRSSVRLQVVVMAFTLDDTLKLIRVSRSLDLPSPVAPAGAEAVAPSAGGGGGPAWASDAARPSLGVIALAMGPAGVTSRVLNRDFTPVSHPLLSAKAAPGQIPSVGRRLRAQLPSRQLTSALRPL